MGFRFPDRVFLIAELSANHGGSLQVCLDTVKAAAEAGADAIKLQTYTPDTITLDSDAEPFQIRHGTLWDGTTLHRLYAEAMTPWEWHAPIFEAAKAVGLTAFSSPFDRTAVDFLVGLDAPIFKIASFEITDIPLIEYAAAQGRPMIISTGVADAGEIEEALGACRRAGNDDVTLLKCTSAYPAKAEEANLATIPDMAKRFGVRVGLSDHTMGAAVPIAATALGARVIEKHFILDRAIGGPDASFSMTPDEFAEMARGVRTAEAAIGAVSYEIAERNRPSRAFVRSLFIAADMKAGEALTPDNMRSVRPGDGLHPRHHDELLGRRLAVDATKGTPLSWEMLAPETANV